MLTVYFISDVLSVPWDTPTFDMWRFDPKSESSLFLDPKQYSPTYRRTIMAKISNFEDITLYCRVYDGKPITTVLANAETAYLNGELIKSTKENKVKSTDIEMRIPEDQMQRLEAIADKIYNSVGPKTWKQKIMGFMFGRAAILSMVGAYFYLGGTSTPTEVIGYDSANGVISIQESGEIVNLLLKNDTLFQGKDKKEGGFYDTILNTLLLDQNVVGLQKEKGWFF